MRTGAGIHVKYIPGTYVPLQNKRNDYLMDRNAQNAGLTFSGIEGIGMQDASLQESMGPIIDRSLEKLMPTDKGIVMARRRLLNAAAANREGKPIPGLSPASQRVRSCALELPMDVPFDEGAKDGIVRELGTDPVSV